MNIFKCDYSIPTAFISNMYVHIYVYVHSCTTIYTHKHVCTYVQGEEDS